MIIFIRKEKYLKFSQYPVQRYWLLSQSFNFTGNIRSKNIKNKHNKY